MTIEIKETVAVAVAPCGCVRALMCMDDHKTLPLKDRRRREREIESWIARRMKVDWWTVEAARAARYSCETCKRERGER